MSSLLDIARSGIQSYQTALRVTAENIANVETEGYARQEVRLADVQGAATAPTVQPGGGGGVTVTEIARAFSDLLSDRTRLAGSVAAAAGQRADLAADIEALFTPGQGGIDAAMADFHGAVSALSASPASLSLRQVVLQAGTALAAQIADVAAGLDSLRAAIGQTAQITADESSALLGQLASLNTEFRALGSGDVEANALATARDQLLAQLSEKIGISASLDARGRADVALQGSGLTLVSGGTAARLSARLTDRVELDLGAGASTTLLVGGVLGGLADALGMVDAAREELDAFAQRLVAVVNAAQTGGADLAGQAGQPMFRMTGWTAAPGLSNGGAAQIALTQTAETAPQGPISLRLGSDGIWTASDAEGAVLGSGATSIALNGLRIDVTGTAAPGDSFDILRRDGRAVDLTMQLRDGALIAAAPRVTVLAASGNGGTAQASITPLTVAPAPVAPLDALLAAGATAADAVALRAPGIVARLPAQGGDLTLASLGTPARATFSADPAAISGATELRITTPTGAAVFDLTQLADGSARPTDWGAAELAAALNDGRLLAAGETLSSLGGRAAGAEGQIQIALASGDFAAAGLTLATGTVPADLTPAEGAGGQVQVFTRAGVHIAGTPLTAAEAAAFVTEANGFLPGASYDASRLNAGYRGAEVTLQAVPGLQAATLGLGGLTLSDAGALAATAARLVSVTMPGLGQADITVPQGASAAQAAAQLNAALPGLRATAATAVELRVPDGRVQFALSGENAIPVTIAADVLGGDLSALAAAITKSSAVTGLRAEVSPQGGRLLLVSDRGATIDIGAFAQSTGAAMTVAEALPDGSTTGAPAQLSPGGAARVTGRVTLSAATGFSVTGPEGRIAAAADPAVGGLMTRTSAQAGVEQRLAISFDPSLDGDMSSGAEAVAASTRYSVTLGGKTATVPPAGIAVASAADVALALAAALRDGAPGAALTGAVLAQLPADGQMLELLADGQTYRLTMVNGVPQISGPEPARITAAVTPDKRLTLSLAGSTDGSGLRVAWPQSSQAAVFGLGAGAVQELRGQPIVAADLPVGGAQLSVAVGGVTHVLTVSQSGGALAVSAPTDFPGAAAIGPDGALTIRLSQGAGPVTIAPSPAAGFATLGASVAAVGGGLSITGAGDVPPALSFTTTSAAPQRLAISGLPGEELLVGMTGAGPLHLAGGAQAGTVAAPSLMLEVVDAALGQVALRDALTGDQIAGGYLDADGRATLAGHAVSLTPGARSGDRFLLRPTGAGSGDGGNLEGLLDSWSTPGGLTERFNLIVSDIGSRTAATNTARDAAEARHVAAQKAEASLSAVDLDTEAARLLQLQQAYQGNARALTVARDLFDTLLKAL